MKNSEETWKTYIKRKQTHKKIFKNQMTLCSSLKSITCVATICSNDGMVTPTHRKGKYPQYTVCLNLQFHPKNWNAQIQLDLSPVGSPDVKNAFKKISTVWPFFLWRHQKRPKTCRTPCIYFFTNFFVTHVLQIFRGCWSRWCTYNLNRRSFKVTRGKKRCQFFSPPGSGREMSVARIALIDLMYEWIGLGISTLYFTHSFTCDRGEETTQRFTVKPFVEAWVSFQ